MDAVTAGATGLTVLTGLIAIGAAATSLGPPSAATAGTATTGTSVAGLSASQGATYSSGTSSVGSAPPVLGDQGAYPVNATGPTTPQQTQQSQRPRRPCPDQSLPFSGVTIKNGRMTCILHDAPCGPVMPDTCLNCGIPPGTWMCYLGNHTVPSTVTPGDSSLIPGGASPPPHHVHVT